MLYARFSIFSPSEATNIFGIVVGILSLLATLHFAPKSRAKAIFFGGISLVSILYLGYLFYLARLAKAPDESLLEEAIQAYQRGEYERAIEDLNSLLAQKDIQDVKLAAQVHYYLALASLKLSPPDCGVAVSQLPQLAPDPGGLVSSLMSECKSAGCVDCGAITPFN